MHNTLPNQAQTLYAIVAESYELPTDDYKHHQWLKPLKLRKGSRSEDNFNQLLEQTFLEPSKGGRNNTQVENLRHHWKALLLNLSFVMYSINVMLVSNIALNEPSGAAEVGAEINRLDKTKAVANKHTFFTFILILVLQRTS